MREPEVRCGQVSPALWDTGKSGRRTRTIAEHTRADRERARGWHDARHGGRAGKRDAGRDAGHRAHGARESAELAEVAEGRHDGVR
jgi:hypothetical protein